MVIMCGGTRTGVDLVQCLICDCNHPDLLDPEAYLCMWPVMQNVRDCNEHKELEVVWQEQCDYWGYDDCGYAVGWLTRRMQSVMDKSRSSDEGSEEQ